MNKKLFSNILAAAVFLALNFNFGSRPIFAQLDKNQSIDQRVAQPGEFSFIDAARAGLSEKQTLQCGAASGRPGWWATGASVRADLSFGLIPASPDTLGSRERYIGSWAVRNFVSTDAGESIASIYFDGFLTGGSVAPLKGGGRGYDLYGAANFTGSLCDKRADYETRFYARLTGACGVNQDINFELSTRPPRNDGLGAYFRDEDIYARGVFNGSVACGTTTDVRRVRTDLSRRR